MYLHIPYMVKYHAKNPPIQEIFKKDKNRVGTKRALMYQDILGYPLRTGINPNFKLRTIGMWLLKNNQELIDEYAGTERNTPWRTRYENRKGRLEAMLEDLVGLRLLTKNTGKAEKVDTTITLYSLTGSGYFVALLIKRKNLMKLLNNSSVKAKDSEELNEINDKLYDFIQSNLKRHNSYHTLALSKEYEIYKDHGWFDMVLYLIESLLYDGREVKTVYEAIEYASLVDIEHRPDIHKGLHKLSLRALNSLDEKTKFVKRVEIKALLENRILEQVPTREWEDLRLHHLNDYSIVMLYGKCHKCNWEDFVESDPIRFINTHIKNSIHSECPNCKGLELHVTTELPSNRVLSLSIN
jgi:hypothetical protein